MPWRQTRGPGGARSRLRSASGGVIVAGEAFLAQQKAKDLLAELRPDGKDPVLDASILVARGYAQIATNNADEAQK